MTDEQSSFLAFTRVEGDCIVWTRKLDDQGYGTYRLRGRSERAHRAAYKLFVGEIPDRKLVLHDCDNPSCVKPDHLHVGTHADNSREMIERKRHRSGQRRHESHVKLELRAPLGCLIWRGATTPRGYPVMKVGGKTRLARRVFYERRRQPLVQGERLKMSCGERLCVEPSHMLTG